MFAKHLEIGRVIGTPRIGDPLEVAGQVITFAAPAGSYMTGQIVYVDGGVTASQ